MQQRPKVSVVVNPPSFVVPTKEVVSAASGLAKALGAKRIAAALALTGVAIEAWRATAPYRKGRLPPYEARVESHSLLYEILLDLASESLPAEDRRLLTVTSETPQGPTSDEGGAGQVVLARVTLPGAVSFTLGDKKFKLRQETPDTDPKVGKRRDALVFVADSHQDLQSLLDFFSTLVSAQGRRQRMFYAKGGWNGWAYISDCRTRSWDTLSLAEGQQERLIADVERFLAARPRYEALGIPWHRGYLFHGPPGTGKTSTALAVASSFGLDAYIMPLSAVTSDNQLQELMSMLPANSVLLIEDVDVASPASLERSTQEVSASSKVTLAGLLNALDGVATPDGLITIMTTNRLDCLDPALVRPGRVDVREELGYLNHSMAMRLAAIMCGRPSDPGDPTGLGATAAELAGVAIPFLDDPDAAESAMKNFLRNRKK